MFGRSETADPLFTYAVLDAASIPLLPDILAGTGLTYRSLFQGETEETFKNAAPYLIGMEEDGRFTRQLFSADGWAKDLWNDGCSTFIRSHRPFNDMRAHLRRFTRIRDETGKWFYFRFWDELCNADAESGWIGKLFSRPDDQIITRIGPDFQRITLSTGSRHFDGPIILTEGWKAQISQSHQAAYARGILQRDHPETARKLDQQLQREWASHMARAFWAWRLQKGWSKEQYIALSIILGTHFDRDATMAQISEYLGRDNPCYLRMADLQDAVTDRMQEILGPDFRYYARALEQFAALDAHRAEALVTREDVLSQVLAFFPEKARQLTPENLSHLTNRSNAIATSAFPPPERRAGAVIIFAHAFLLGEGSLDDPLHDYLRRILRADLPDKTQRLFRYGQRRARAQLREIAKINGTGG